MSDFLLSLKDVSLAFGGPAVLDKVSLSVSKGLRAALTGRNGEGKSTLFRVIAGELEPDTGEIIRAPGLKTVFVSQAVPADRPGDDVFNSLSGGKRRRKILEEALLSRPDLLLLDEPASALDPANRRLAYDFLEEYACDHTVLAITHDLTLPCRGGGVLFLMDKAGNFHAGEAGKLLNSDLLSQVYNTPTAVENSNGKIRVFFD